MFETPIVLIVFNRPQLVVNLLSKLQELKPRVVYVISDGPRDNSPDDEAKVTMTRDLFDNLEWSCEVIKIYAETNQGLRSSVLSGLDKVFSREDSAIILEDDCLPTNSFFRFSEEMLRKYADEPRIQIISGNNFNPRAGQTATYMFSTQMHIWGWATWRRAWLAFRAESKFDGWTREEISSIVSKINPQRYKKLLRKQMERSGELDSWAIGFSVYAQSREKLSIVPSQNLVQNLGFGEGSTHTKFRSFVHEVPVGELDFPLKTRDEIAPSLKFIESEARAMALKWLIFPLRHPINFLARIRDYLKLVYKI